MHSGGLGPACAVCTSPGQLDLNPAQTLFLFLTRVRRWRVSDPACGLDTDSLKSLEVTQMSVNRGVNNYSMPRHTMQSESVLKWNELLKYTITCINL